MMPSALLLSAFAPLSLVAPAAWQARTATMSMCTSDGRATPARDVDVAAMLAAADAAREREAAAMLGSAAGASDDPSEDGEPDWVRARVQQEDRTFRAKRDAARVARAAAWLDEERRVRAAEFGATSASVDGATAAWMDEERAVRAAEAAAMLGGPADHIAEYEARVKERARPKTAEEKRAEYAQDQLRQIAEADAMDERLARRQRAAREGRGGGDEAR